MTSKPARRDTTLVPRRVGFFRPRAVRRGRQRESRMDESSPTRAQQVGRAASAFERERTGRLAGSVAVAVSGDTLVVTLGGALSPAERALGTNPSGAALVQEFHRAVFASACGPLLRDIARITGTEVREAAADARPAAGAPALGARRAAGRGVLPPGRLGRAGGGVLPQQRAVAPR